MSLISVTCIDGLTLTTAAQANSNEAEDQIWVVYFYHRVDDGVLLMRANEISPPEKEFG